MKPLAGLVCLFVIPLSCVSVAAAAPYLDQPRTEALCSIQQLVYRDRFAAADSACRTFVAQYPDDPIGYFFQAVTLMAHMIDREDPVAPARYDSLLDRADSLALTRLAHPDSDARSWMYLIRGHIKAYRSIYESRFGSFTSAVRLGLGAKGEYLNGLREDSTNLDIYAGLGSYHYWKSAKTGFLRWLGLFRNDKERGLTELYRAADSSTISRETARSALIWIRIDQKLYDSAIAICREMIARYPEGNSFRWPLAQALFETRDYPASLATYDTLRSHLAADPGNYYNLIACDAAIVRCHEHLGHSDAARTAAERLADYVDQIPDRTRRRLKGEIGYLRRVATGK